MANRKTAYKQKPLTDNPEAKSLVPALPDDFKIQKVPSFLPDFSWKENLENIFKEFYKYITETPDNYPLSETDFLEKIGISPRQMNSLANDKERYGEEWCEKFTYLRDMIYMIEYNRLQKLALWSKESGINSNVALSRLNFLQSYLDDKAKGGQGVATPKGININNIVNLEVSDLRQQIQEEFRRIG